jgi:hypothetical protein
MAADDVAVLRLRDGCDDGATHLGVGRRPMDGKTRLSAWFRVGRETYVIGSVRVHDNLRQKKRETARRRQTNSTRLLRKMAPAHRALRTLQRQYNERTKVAPPRRRAHLSAPTPPGRHERMKLPYFGLSVVIHGRIGDPQKRPKRLRNASARRGGDHQRGLLCSAL